MFQLGVFEAFVKADLAKRQEMLRKAQDAMSQRKVKKTIPPPRVQRQPFLKKLQERLKDTVTRFRLPDFFEGISEEFERIKDKVIRGARATNHQDPDIRRYMKGRNPLQHLFNQNVTLVGPFGYSQDTGYNHQNLYSLSKSGGAGKFFLPSSFYYDEFIDGKGALAYDVGSAGKGRREIGYEHRPYFGNRLLSADGFSPHGMHINTIRAQENEFARRSLAVATLATALGVDLNGALIRGMLIDDEYSLKHGVLRFVRFTDADQPEPVARHSIDVWYDQKTKRLNVGLEGDGASIFLNHAYNPAMEGFDDLSLSYALGRGVGTIFADGVLDKVMIRSSGYQPHLHPLASERHSTPLGEAWFTKAMNRSTRPRFVEGVEVPNKNGNGYDTKYILTNAEYEKWLEQNDQRLRDFATRHVVFFERYSRYHNLTEANNEENRAWRTERIITDRIEGFINRRTDRRARYMPAPTEDELQSEVYPNKDRILAFKETDFYKELLKRTTEKDLDLPYGVSEVEYLAYMGYIYQGTDLNSALRGTQPAPYGLPPEHLKTIRDLAETAIYKMAELHGNTPHELYRWEKFGSEDELLHRLKSIPFGSVISNNHPIHATDAEGEAHVRSVFGDGIDGRRYAVRFVYETEHAPFSSDIYDELIARRSSNAYQDEREHMLPHNLRWQVDDYEVIKTNGGPNDAYVVEVRMKERYDREGKERYGYGSDSFQFEPFQYREALSQEMYDTGYANREALFSSWEDMNSITELHDLRTSLTIGTKSYIDLQGPFQQDSWLTGIHGYPVRPMDKSIAQVIREAMHDMDADQLEAFIQRYERDDERRLWLDYTAGGYDRVQFGVVSDYDLYYDDEDSTRIGKYVTPDDGIDFKRIYDPSTGDARIYFMPSLLRSVDDETHRELMARIIAKSATTFSSLTTKGADVATGVSVRLDKLVREGKYDEVLDVRREVLRDPNYGPLVSEYFGPSDFREGKRKHYAIRKSRAWSPDRDHTFEVQAKETYFIDAVPAHTGDTLQWAVTITGELSDIRIADEQFNKDSNIASVLGRVKIPSGTQTASASFLVTYERARFEFDHTGLHPLRVGIIKLWTDVMAWILGGAGEGYTYENREEGVGPNEMRVDVQQAFQHAQTEAERSLGLFA